MNSSQTIEKSYSSLKSALERLMRGRDAEVALRRDGEQPLLVMKTDSDSAGFAVMNGNPQEAYELAYSTFKEIYRNEHSSWSSRNLSFVVCRTERRQDEDSFFSQLEADPYFCRKYVLDLSGPAEELEQELLRLPFLPLKEDAMESAARPPSAQSLLQQHGVSATLAKYLIVPRVRSPERIVKEIQADAGLIGQIRKSPGVALRRPFEHTEHIRITRLEIEAFRAYRKKQ